MVRPATARFGWRLGVLGASLLAVLALTVPPLGEARAIEATLLAPVETPAELELDAPTYTVQEGDTLYAIARASGVGVDQIVALNGLPDPDLIRIGQVLTLPADPRASSTPRVNAATVAGSYTVQTGDTLYAISMQYDVPLAALASWNGLADPDRIATGAKLSLTGTGAGNFAASAPAEAGVWVGSPNYWPGRPNGQPIALVVHTMGGNIDGAMGEFANPSSNASAHFGIGLDGRVDQYVDLTDRAWANGVLEPEHIWPGPAGVNPNELTVSIETEDLGDAKQAVTEAQYQATLRIGRLVLSQYPSIRYLVTHRAISPQSRPNDPGARWQESGRLAALAKALGLKLLA